MRWTATKVSTVRIDGRGGARGGRVLVDAELRMDALLLIHGYLVDTFLLGIQIKKKNL